MMNKEKKSPASRKQRRIGRSKRKSSKEDCLAQMPFKQLRIPFKPMELVSEDQLETIHHASLRILQEVGLQVERDAALRLLKDLRADVDWTRNRVRFDPNLIDNVFIDSLSLPVFLQQCFFNFLFVFYPVRKFQVLLCWLPWI